MLLAVLMIAWSCMKMRTRNRVGEGEIRLEEGRVLGKEERWEI